MYSAEIRTRFGAESSCFSSLLRSDCSFSLRVAVLCVLTVIPTHSPLVMNIVAGYASITWIKGRAKDKLVGSPGENGGGQHAQKDLHSRTGRDETKRKTRERMERRSRKRSAGAGGEKMERVGHR